jgi:flavin-binding protein dodecin
MTNHVYKLVDVVGTSTAGLEDAIQRAIKTASKTIDNIDWFQVDEVRGHVVDGDVGHYQVVLKLGFRLNDE